jgi:hypothetical protein
VRRRRRRRKKGPPPPQKRKISAKWTAIGMTPLMCDALIDNTPKELIGETRDLRIRLCRLSRCVTTGYKRPWLVVRGDVEAKNMMVWLQHAAHNAPRAAPATKGALFGRMAQLARYLDRSPIEVLGALA